MGKSKRTETSYIKKEMAMVSKEEAAEHLKSCGYDSFTEDGVVWVRTADHGAVKKVHNELKKIGYGCSFGFKFVKKESA